MSTVPQLRNPSLDKSINKVLKELNVNESFTTFNVNEWIAYKSITIECSVYDLVIYNCIVVCNIEGPNPEVSHVHGMGRRKIRGKMRIQKCSAQTTH
jgi:hypothetical protein